MKEKMKAMYQKLEELLAEAPEEGECSPELDEVFAEMTNLKNALKNAGMAVSSDEHIPFVKEEERPELIGQVIDLFEDFLDEKGIVLENEERDENMDGEDPDSMANIYGSDYDELQDGLEKIFRGWKIF